MSFTRCLSAGANRWSSSPAASRSRWATKMVLALKCTDDFAEQHV